MRLVRFTDLKSCLTWIVPVLALLLWGGTSAHANGVNSTIASGQVVTGTVTTTGVDSYTFPVAAGDSIFVSVAQIGAWTFDPVAILYDPNGTGRATATLHAYANTEYVNAAAGSWTVKVSVWQATAGGDYSLTVVTIPGPFVVADGHAGGAMYPEVTYPGSIYRGDVDIFTFTGVAGVGNKATLTVDITGGAWDPAIRVYRPDGSVYGGDFDHTNYTYDVSLDPRIQPVPGMNGTYTVLVYKWIGDDVTGSYSISVSGSGVGTPPNDATTDGKGLGGSPYSGCPLCGDPINVGSGNVFEAATDYETAGQNKLSFRRYYNSLAAAASSPTALGSRWRSNYDRSLAIGASTVIATRADGQQLTFTLNGSSWVGDTDIDMTLSQSGSTWTVTDHQDVVETYLTTSSGNAAILQSIKARNGYLQTLTYDGSNQLQGVTDSYNRSLAFTYNGALLDTVTTPDGLVLTYGYDSSGITPGVDDRLASVSYSTNPVTKQTYLYEQPSHPFALTGITDENGQRYATWTYDQAGRGSSAQRGASADLTTVSYDDSTGDRTVTNALGQPDVYHFQLLQRVPKVTEIDRQATATTAAAQRLFTYDSNGYTASVTDWNGVLTRYTNNSRGDPTVIEEAVATPQARTTTLTYDPVFVRLPAQIATPGLTTTFIYDGSGNLLTRTLTDTTTQKKPYKTKGQTRTWTYTWNNSLLASVKRPRTDVNALTQFTYDNSGALTATTNALNQTTQIPQHLPGGLPQTIVDPNGVTTTLVYDPRLRLLTSTTTSASLVTTFGYDPAGNVTSVMLPDGSALLNGYDAAHRLTSITDLFNQKLSYGLDGLGDRLLTQALDAGSTVHRQHSGIFDALGRTLEDIGGAGQTTVYGYDDNGNAVTVTDPRTHVTQRAFDAFNRIAQVTQPAPVGGTIVTSYDAHDRPLSVTDPNGSITTYIYDGFGDLIEQVSPDSGTTVYHYDADGNLVLKKDGAKAVTAYKYDALDRLVAREYPADKAENVTFTYDETGHGFGIGRLTSVADQAGTLSRAYDERGNITAETRVTPTASLSTFYGYDGASRIATITYPSGWTVSYDRDIAGRVTGVGLTAPASSTRMPLVTGITYEPFGPVNGLTFGNGVAETHGFDLDYRMTTLTDTGASPLQDLTYGYDPADNVRTIVDAISSSGSQTFDYDVLNRLIAATGAYGSLGYTYDAVGNVATQTTDAVSRTLKYKPKTNRLIEIDDGATKQKIATTAAGSISGFKPAMGGVTKLLYNKANRLTAVKAKSAVVGQYIYDAFGQRLIKVAVGTTVFGYDLSGQLLEETTAGAFTDYVYLSGRPIVALTPSSGSVGVLLDDHLGTPRQVVDSNQSTIWSATYQPFGVATITGVATQNLRFPGQHADPESGFSQNGFRDYVPGLGRYLETDPLGFRGGLNTFVYVMSNPITLVDRRGTQLAEPDASEETFLEANDPFPPQTIVYEPASNTRSGLFDIAPSVKSAELMTNLSELLDNLQETTAIGDDMDILKQLVGQGGQSYDIHSGALLEWLHSMGSECSASSPTGQLLSGPVVENPH